MAYVLTETAAGYALLKASDKKIHKSATLIEDLNTAEKLPNNSKFIVLKSSNLLLMLWKKLILLLKVKFLKVYKNYWKMLKVTRRQP